MTLISALIAAIVMVSIFVVFPDFGFMRLISPLRWAFLALMVSE